MNRLALGMLFSAPLGLLATPALCGAQEGATPPGGIPVASELVVENCSRCHRQDESGLMSRISYLRKTPEGWSASIRRMMSLNGASVDPAEAREIVRYLANRHGIAPEELRPALYEVERRKHLERRELPDVVRRTCTSCHSIGRIATQRRTAEEWTLIAETHRGLYPLIDGQVFRRGPGSTVEDDFEFAVEAAVAQLAEDYPLHTPEWADWSRNMRPAQIAGTWAISGYEIGRGPFYGTVSITAVDGRSDEFTTTATYAYPAEDRAVVRRGDGLVYTGYQWRGRSQAEGAAHPELREVMFVERGWSEMHGRWFTGAYEEIGVDVHMVRVGSERPVVLGTYPGRVQAGRVAQLQLFGVNLPPDLAAEQIDLGPGVEVVGVTERTPGAVTLDVRVAPDAAEGARDAVVGGSAAPGILVVYDALDYIRVEPHPAMARVGGANFPPGIERFEAVGYTDGPDGEEGTEDDVRVGAVEAEWSLVEYPRTYDDDDVDFVGTIDQSGLFTPALDGPNPERSGNRNNIGEVWVTAEHRAPGAPADAPSLRARAYLVVSPPLYIEWEAGAAASLRTTLEDGP
jgi:quinohemoprotein amine dehydrogenase